MKRTKRKYTRKATITPVESKSSGIETEGSAMDYKKNPVILESHLEGIADGTIKPFTFEDLPLSVRMGVENAIKLRTRLKLPDNSEERKAQAIKYFRGDRPR